MTFQIDERLAQDTIEVTNLKLSYVGLMDDQRFPWLILVPRIENSIEITDLSEFDRHLLIDETLNCSTVLQSMYRDTYKMNIGALGNVVRQLHVHVIARTQTDDAWPNPVWGVGECVPYPRDEVERLVLQLRTKLA